MSTATSEQSPESLSVVGIGASAGGLDAIFELLETLPATTGLVFLIVTHLDPNHESLLPEILRKRTSLPVHEAENGVAVAADHIYVSPAGKLMTLDGGRLALASREDSTTPHLPINALFRSLARPGQCSIAVVLSGSGSDGTEGTLAIKEAGGIVLVQEPRSAGYAGMPESAIHAGCADQVLSARGIGRALARLGDHSYFNAQPAEQVAGLEVVPLGTDELAPVFNILFATYRADFSQYKSNTVQRRIRRRMALRQVEKIADYVTLLHGEPAEVASLYDDLLIRVTSFFRESGSLTALTEAVFPVICANRTRADPIRIWVPGCASGEEVYSIAMLLLEFLGDRVTDIPLQIFGTDLSDAAIEKARTARYPETIAERVSTKRLQRFFVRERRAYRIAKWVRQLCLFSRHNVARDPPFARLDLVSCCNMMIYLNTSMQRQVMRNFHYALKPNAFLLIGPAENIGDSLYFRKAEPHATLHIREPLAVRSSREVHSSLPPVRTRKTSAEDAMPIVDIVSIQHRADALLLSRFGPPSVLVDNRMNVINFHGPTSRYLEHASGTASLNLHRIAKPEVLLPILAAIQEAEQSNTRTYRSGVRVVTHELAREIDLEVVPIHDPASGAHFFLVLFEPASANTYAGTARALPATDSEKDQRILQLERELDDVRAYTDAIAATHETSHEEAQAAAEELMSMNEEFQSANEELESAREELQSSNEELTTSNEELVERSRELERLNQQIGKKSHENEQARRYADAIIETVAHPLLVLDYELVVQRANRSFYETFKTTVSDTLNKHIFNLENGQWQIASLKTLLEDILSTRSTVTNYKLTHDFPSIGPRTMLLHASKVVGDDERATQILLGMQDVSNLEAAEENRNRADRRKDEFLAMLSHELRNPLAPITNALSIIQNLVKDEAVLRYLAMVGRHVGVMARLLDDLLDISRITHGLIRLDRKPQDLRTLVSEAVGAVTPYLTSRRLSIDTDMPDEHMIVNVDAVRVQQVVGNLLSNAAKYSDEGGNILVTLITYKDEGILTVRDKGIGMTASTIPHIFDLFAQAHPEPGLSRGGLGIGLTLVRRLTELHGGSVSARSDGPGLGSELEVRLPLARDAPQPARIVRKSAPATTAPINPLRVLVVDDNEDSALTVVELLKIWGHHPFHAFDGRSGLAIARREKPDVGLLDIGLPDITGYQLAREIRKLTGMEQIHLIAMTGYGQSTDRAEALNAGFAVHLVKPVDIDALQTVLADIPPRRVTQDV